MPTKSPPPPRAGTLWLVSAYRITNGERERITRLFRQQAAAARYADQMREAGKHPVSIYRSHVAPWRPWEVRR